ncbi:MAG: ATP-dependent DNA helicase RecG [Hyphomicrobiales bacterium]|nr:ATP-dependent DNA helicase RecG [Hyphomicrobiales bacterium]MDE2113306.1 ATP-dependent DNA helicase RecG [Hyphomicrobiales bacterium]
MRPALLDPLFADASRLQGIGPKMALALDRLLAAPPAKARIIDVLLHVPAGLTDRRSRPKIVDAVAGTVVTLHVQIVELQPPPPRSRAPYKVLVEDETGDCLLVFFLANHDWIERMLPVGEKRYVSGKLELWDGHRQIVHPDKVLDEAAFAKMPLLEPVYGLTEGLPARIMLQATTGALARLPGQIPEWLDSAFLRQRKWPDFNTALEAVHRPQDPGDIALEGVGRTRLAYDELLSQQLALLMVRAHRRKPAGHALKSAGRLADQIIKALAYRPTNAQTRALSEIIGDMASDHRMLRLLQGDVGSGKTLVALLAMAHAVEGGRQAAMMAPTEILARQHYARLLDLCTSVGIRLACMTGRDKPAERQRTLEQLAAGQIDILLGTHALFQESVAFANLGLVIVDEQHRFGVQQRLALGAKGDAVDVLVMTATPIPRSLVLTHFGDMEVSVLDEKPPGRSPIVTRTIPSERIGDVVAGLGRALQTGQRAYWICPLVDENEDLDLAAATARFEDLKQYYGDKVGIIHGQMHSRDKEAAMEAFSAGVTQILVATIVVEVGVDVPEASIMVIEHAERFGLAQLHQLRGRVGRGAAQSSCILLYRGPLGEAARQRLQIMRDTEDGFEIAEMDLRLRGEGEILGTRQSGLPAYRLADLTVHAPLLPIARDDAKLVLARDADLASARGQALRALLYLFERNEAVRLLRAG